MKSMRDADVDPVRGLPESPGNVHAAGGTPNVTIGDDRRCLRSVNLLDSAPAEWNTAAAGSHLDHFAIASSGEEGDPAVVREDLRPALHVSRQLHNQRQWAVHDDGRVRVHPAPDAPRRSTCERSMLPLRNRTCPRCVVRLAQLLR